MTAAKNPTSKVVAEILAGRHRGHIGELLEAIVEYTNGDSGVRLLWVLRLDGDEWDEDSVTTGELVFVEKLLSTPLRPFSYLQIDPKTKLDHRTALVVAHLHEIGGMSVEDAFKRAKAMTQAEQRDLIDQREVVDAPKDDPAASPTS